MKSLSRLFPVLVLLVPLAAAEGDLARQKQLSEESLKMLASSPTEAARLCAESLKLGFTNSDAQACAKEVSPKLDEVVKAAESAIEAGQFSSAQSWCTAVLVIQPGNAGARKCVATANARSIEHGKDLIELQTARQKVKAGDPTGADASLQKVAGTKFPDIALEAVALRREVAIMNEPPLAREGHALAVYAAGAYLNSSQGVSRVPDTTALANARKKCEEALRDHPRSHLALECLKIVRSAEQEDADRKQLAEIVKAENQISDGARNDAIATLKPVIESAASAAVRAKAQELLQKARVTPKTVYWDAVNSRTVFQFLGALSVMAVFWFVPHLVRRAWRWIFANIFGRLFHIRWTFIGVEGDKKLGATEPTLDALKRIPNEVRKPIWRPTRLVFHSNAGRSLEIWEDCFLPNGQKAPNLHENVFRTDLWQGRAANNALADAFQQLTFNVGGMGFGIVAKFWRALLDWWHDGEPAFSGVAKEIPGADGKQNEIAIRLTTSGGQYGTVSVLASSSANGDVDQAVALTAERAAYKLLYRIAQDEDTAEQVDAHAAFRQGAKLLSCVVRSVADTEADRKAREEHAGCTVKNLEFARQVFARDPSHVVYYQESLRLLAVAFVVLGRYEAALLRLRELQNAVAGKTDDRAKHLEVEALYNQAILHYHCAWSGDVKTSRELAIAEFFLREVKNRLEDPLSKLAIARVAALAANMSGGEWIALGSIGASQMLAESTTALRNLRALQEVAEDRLAAQILACELVRNIGISQMRYIASFLLNNRMWWEPECPKELLCAVNKELKPASAALAKADVLPPTALSQAMRAYALLLTRRFEEAELYAVSALSLDKSNPWACYVAAESCFQRNQPSAAFKHMKEFDGAGTFQPLVSLLAVLPKADAAGA